MKPSAIYVPLALVVIAIVAIVALVRWLEPRMAFHPFTGETDTPRTFGVTYEAVTLTTTDGERLRAWRINAPSPRARIVYFHGNGGNLSNWAPILVEMVRRGYSVFAIDYRGYGVSSGTPTERGLYRDVDAAIQNAWPSTSADVPVVYWGRSLGVSMAAYGATVRKPDGAIVEAGFANVRAVARSSPVLAFLSFFASYRFPAGEFLNKAGAPVLAIHGDRDSIIPYSVGRELYDEITAPKQFVTVAGGDHNDAVAPDAKAYWAAIDRFIASLRR